MQHYEQSESPEPSLSPLLSEKPQRESSQSCLASSPLRLYSVVAEIAQYPESCHRSAGLLGILLETSSQQPKQTSGVTRRNLRSTSGRSPLQCVSLASWTLCMQLVMMWPHLRPSRPSKNQQASGARQLQSVIFAALSHRLLRGNVQKQRLHAQKFQLLAFASAQENQKETSERNLDSSAF